MFAVTSDRLRLTTSERVALRRSGLQPGDIRHLAPEDVVAATSEEIDEARAAELVELADLIGIGVGTDHAITLRRLGVSGRSDLATRDPGELFVGHLASSARTHPHAYDAFCRAVYLARGEISDPSRLRQVTWTRERERSGFDPLVLFWRHRHGESALPAPTSERVRAPTVGISSRIVAGSVDARGEPTMPLDQREVSRVVVDDRLVCIGHWSWNGGNGAFFRLEELLLGDGVQVGGQWYAVEAVQLVACPNESMPQGDLVLATPPHRRVGIIGTEDMLLPVERGVLRCVVVGSRSSRESVDTTRREVPQRLAAY